MEIRKATNQQMKIRRAKEQSIKVKTESIKLAGVQGAKSATREIDGGQEILDATMTAYVISKPVRATAKQGKKLIKVDRFYPSSKHCSCCGAVKKELGLSERVYICGCGNSMDRDVNAAVNIREEGRRLLMTA